MMSRRLSASRSIADVIYLGVAVGLLCLAGCRRQPPTFEIEREEFIDTDGERIEVAAREVLVQLKPGLVQAEVIRRIPASVDLDVAETLGGDFVRIKSRSQSASTLVTLDAIRSIASYVGPNHILYGATAPDDTHFPGQWGLDNPAAPVADIRAVTAWDLVGNPDASAAKVAVLDSGINADHEDLKNSMWSAPGAFTITVGTRTWNCSSHDHGVNVLAGGDCNTGPVGSNGHGTKVAGIVGAAGNNHQGVTGVAWKASLVSVVVMNANNYATEAGVATGIDVAIAIGKSTFSGSPSGKVKVISISIVTSADAPVLRAAIQRAAAAGLLIVAAAGNNGTDNDASPFYPASYTDANIVAVAATNKSGALMGMSNYGVTSVDLAAPGFRIYTTEASGGYGSGYDNTGTSMAVPFVSGAAALLFSKCPNSSSLTPTAVKQLLTQSVDQLPGLTMKVASGGRLNLYKALRACGLGGR